MRIGFKELDFTKGNGLLPVVVQENKTKDILMVAYMNEEALRKTIDSGYATYWSRSRRKLWMKGETSGNTQKVTRILVDCDYDVLLLFVEQKGHTCHTGNQTCFHNQLE